MIVRADGIFGTIGGGALEFEMLAMARAMLPQSPAGRVVRQVLGLDLGQCCGGQVDVAIETFSRVDLPWIRSLALAEGRGAIRTLGRPDGKGRLIRRLGGPAEAVGSEGETAEHFGEDRTPLLLFGAGHVGRALVFALAPLPFRIDWIDTRREAFPGHAPGDMRLHCPADPRSLLDQAAPGSLVAIMTHSHALDLALAARSLADGRFPYVGLIGSQTKRGRFLGQLRKAGLDAASLKRLVCPIGGARLADKSPAVIAAAVAVELLEMRERLTLSDAS